MEEWNVRLANLKWRQSRLEMICSAYREIKWILVHRSAFHSHYRISRPIGHFTNLRSGFISLFSRDKNKNPPRKVGFELCQRHNVFISSSFSNTVWYREYRVISFDIVALSCVFVRYREYREYRCIKCCTKFAPKSHQRLTPIQLVKLEFVLLCLIRCAQNKEIQ